jgi:hypothetical protein
MRVAQVWAIAVAVGILGATLSGAPAQDADRVIPGGGIFVQGWTGKIDASSEGQGRTVNDAKFIQEGNMLHVTTGPATTFWNPANKASGDYTVKGTFTEPKYMDLNSHPHSYGIFIGGNDLGTDQQSLVYCAAYGNGNFIIRGFAPGTPRGTFQMNGGRGANSPAVHRAAGPGQPVTQEIAWTVKGGRAECSINGTVVGGYDQAELVGAGKLKSTDGVYGLRFTHNVEATISGFGMTK